jgi:glycosyl transferase family 1
MMEKLPVLVLVRNYTSELSYYDDWLDGFRRFDGFTLDVENIGDARAIPRIAKKIECAPFVIALHSTIGDGTGPMRPLEGPLKNRQGKFGVFVGNEVNLPLALMADKIRFLKETEADLILTQLLEETGRWYYAPVSSAKVRCITHALNPEAFRPGPPLSARKIDIGARSHRYSLHIGDNQRVAIHDFFEQNAGRLGVTTDIELGGQRFDRAGWVDFLQKCRGTISTEAGSAFLSRDDATTREIQAILRDRGTNGRLILAQNSTLRNTIRRLFPPWAKAVMRKMLDRHTVEDFALDSILSEEEMDAVRSAVFTRDKRAEKYSKAISSRHFEAIGTKTVQIMTNGRYNDILVPGDHFISLEEDFSNIDDVMARFSDLDHCQKLVDAAHQYVRAEHTYHHRMKSLYEILHAIA